MNDLDAEVNARSARLMRAEPGLDQASAILMAYDELSHELMAVARHRLALLREALARLHGGVAPGEGIDDALFLSAIRAELGSAGEAPVGHSTPHPDHPHCAPVSRRARLHLNRSGFCHGCAPATGQKRCLANAGPQR